MEKRIPGSMRTREALSELIEGHLSTPDARSQLVLLATRLIVEEALEAESRDALGRGYYEHGGDPGRGYRNGNRTGRLKTAEGMVNYTAPQIAGREEAFHSEIRTHLKGRSEALEDLAVEMLARGLSVRDIEDTFRNDDGSLLLSRTAVSEIGERLWEDYQAFASRDLGGYDIAYLFVDGIAERIRPGQRREPVLAAWGLTHDGKKVLLHMMSGSKEDPCPPSSRTCGPAALAIRCWWSRMALRGSSRRSRPAFHAPHATVPPHLAAKVSREDAWPEVREQARAAYQAPSRAIARDLAADLVRTWESEFPTAVTCFQDDFEACICECR